MKYWTVPRMWEGRTVAILASGSSMNASVAQMVRDSGIPAVAINSTYRLAPWAAMIYAADVAWWKHNRNALAIDTLKVCCIADPKEHVAPDGVLCLRMSGSNGIDDDRSALRTGGNSGYQAIHIAYHAGASRILLCGMNMSGPNWHGRHPAPLRNTGEQNYVTWRRGIEALIDELTKRSVAVVNCTPNSSLRGPIVPLEEALAESCLSH